MSKPVELPFKEKVTNSLEDPDVFWIDKPYLLIHPMRLVEFVPLKDMTDSEKLNAIARFSIYLSLAFMLLYWNLNYMYIAIIGLTFTYIVNYGQKDKMEKILESFRPEDKVAVQEGKYGITGIGLPCQKPSRHNPFMNVQLTDYVDNPNRPPACNVDDKDTRKSIDHHYDHNLYRDIDNVWDKNNSQRQYYTTPSTTIPNDRESFANWLYKPRYVCKDGDLMACQRWQDRWVHGKL